jgi:hypothetical protein
VSGFKLQYGNEKCRFSAQFKFVFMSTFTKTFLKKKPVYQPFRIKRKVGFEAGFKRNWWIRLWKTKSL